MGKTWVLAAPYLARPLGAPTTGQIGCAWPCCGEGELDIWSLIEKGTTFIYLYIFRSKVLVLVGLFIVGLPLAYYNEILDFESHSSILTNFKFIFNIKYINLGQR